MLEKITIKRIAELAGVSTAAVSYVLNEKKGVSKETRQRILSIMKDMNYTPNVNSRRLILKRSFNIMVSLDTRVSTLNNFFYTEILNAIVGRATELGYNTVLSDDSKNDEKENLLSELRKNNADGIIFLRDISSSLCTNIRQTGAPFVVIDSHKTEPPYYHVKADMKLASYVATKYLIDHNHTRIAFIGMDRLPDFYIQTFSGFKLALEEAGLPIRAGWIQTSAYDDKSAQLCMRRILSEAEQPTAVFCTSDIYAIGAMNFLQKQGYSIPEDFSFCSMDDILPARLYYPALTTVHIDAYQMGISAVNILDKLINGAQDVHSECIVSNHLVARDTVATVADA